MQEVKCPAVESEVSCVTTSTLLILFVAQLAGVIAYFMYRCVITLSSLSFLSFVVCTDLLLSQLLSGGSVV